MASQSLVGPSFCSTLNQFTPHMKNCFNPNVFCMSLPISLSLSLSPCTAQPTHTPIFIFAFLELQGVASCFQDAVRELLSAPYSLPWCFRAGLSCSFDDRPGSPHRHVLGSVNPILSRAPGMLKDTMILVMVEFPSSIYLSIYLSINPSIQSNPKSKPNQSIYLSIGESIYLSIVSS